MRALAFFAAFLCPFCALAQPLADKVPADAILYAAWQGAEHLGPGYEQSNLKGLIEQSDLARFMSQLGPTLARMARGDGPEAVARLQMLGQIGEALWRHPCAFYLVGVEMRPMPVPQLALISRPGRDADRLLGQFQALVKQIREQDPDAPIEAFRIDDVVGLQVGFVRSAEALAAPGRSIAQAEPFRKAMAGMHRQPLQVAYVDLRRMLAQFEQVIQLMGDPDTRRTWPGVRDALGLPGLTQAILTSGFDERDWSTRLFVGAPAPRHGLLGLIEARPVNNQLLQRIPASSAWMVATHFDMDRLITRLRDSAAKIDPGAPAALDQGMAQIRLMTGVDVQKDLLGALGEHWAFYNDPQSTGRGVLGTVIVNRPRKPAELEKALNHIAEAADNMIRQQAPDPEMRVRIARAQAVGVNLIYVPLPFIAPALGIRDGTLYVGLYPQMVVTAANAPQGRSILDNPDYIALQKRLAPHPANHILFMDLPRLADESYPTLLMLSQLFTGMSDMAGADVPPLVMPMLPQIRRYLAPAGSAVWVDDAGLHARSISPFPGAELLGGQAPGIFAAAPILAGMQRIQRQQAGE
jgi:hypothetical protein